MILFVGAIMAASALAGAGIGITAELADAYENRLEQRADRLDVDFEIINDPRNVSTNPLEIHILNTGASVIDTGQLIVFVDGEASTDYSATTVQIHAGAWSTLTIPSPSIGPGDHVVRILDPRGAEDELRFYEAPP